MIKQIQEHLKQELNNRRYEHTLGVMYTAASLAMCHGQDVNQAMIAGLLHDCAKCISTKDSLALCNKYSIQLTESELNNPALIHAKLGSVLAKEVYDIQDPDILSAIEFHTTGRANMTTLEKIIYLADYIEPYRSIPNLDSMRHLAFNNLDMAMEECSNRTLTHLRYKNMHIDPISIETYNFYKELNTSI